MDPIKIIQDNEFLPAALGIFDLARHSISILTYKFELSERTNARELNSLIHRLYALAAQGIYIRILLNVTGRRSGLTRINENAAMALKKKGLQVRCLPDGRCQHAKVILVDGCYGIIGSHNWSPRSMNQNLEVSVLIYGPQYLHNVQKMFAQVWADSKEL